jgi:hypothetical protein
MPCEGRTAVFNDLGMELISPRELGAELIAGSKVLWSNAIRRARRR